ncbi:MAG: thiamine phosphate synthase [Candidatus Omnitrophica bacterium]|nr:thiamine phosphate synthase [Candidatus Omnitrophota bacterium]
MRSREKPLEGSRLCVIIDRDILTLNRALKTARIAVKAGADIIQLRCKGLNTEEAIKTAVAIRLITRQRATFIVNDKPEITIASEADGLHIGKGDVDIKLARRLLGRKKIIGISASGLKEAIAAKKAGASYLGVGPVFKTPIKCGKRPVGVKPLVDIGKLNIPFFAIGGIDVGNIQKLTSKGFKRVAVIRAVSVASRPFLAVRRLKEALA